MSFDTLIRPAVPIALMLAVPLGLLAFPSPPSGLSGAPGEGTCASCHSGAASPTGTVSLTFPGGLTYTPGVAQQIQVTVSETGKTRWGFELSARTSSNGQAGTLASVDSNTQVLTSGGIQYQAETSAGTQAGTANTASWNFSWTPPSTNAGVVTFYVVGLACNNNGGTGGDDTLTSTFALSPAAGGTGTLTVSPATLTFTSNSGAAPPSQTFNVSSSGASIAFTTSVSTTSGGNWLSALPTGGSTPLDVTVSVNPAGLAAGTFNGTVSVASTAASNSPQTVGVTLTVTGNPPVNPALQLSPASLTFNSTNGGAVSPQNVQVTSSGSALSFTTSVTTASGGNWLSVNPASGSTPETVAVSANVSGLSPGTYSGSVIFTATGAVNSPRTLGVTLIVGSPQPPPGNPGPLSFSFNVLDKESNGPEHLLLSGQGSIDAGGRLTGSGNFNRFTSAGEEGHQTVAVGAWKAMSVTSFTPAAGSSGGEGGEDGGGASGGILEITVQIMPMGGAAVTGTMRIANTGSDRGVTLTIQGGPTFVPTGAGNVSIRRNTSTGGGREAEDN